MPSINLSEEQYKKLMDMMYLGNWMINSFKIDDQEQEYEELEQLVLSNAPDAIQQEYIIYDNESEEYYTNRNFEDHIDKYIQEYDNYTFWDELASRLASRDMRRQIGPVHKIKDEHWEIKHKLEEAYAKEFAQNDLRNVNVDIKDKPR